MSPPVVPTTDPSLSRPSETGQGRRPLSTASSNTRFSLNDSSYALGSSSSVPYSSRRSPDNGDLVGGLWTGGNGRGRGTYLTRPGHRVRGCLTRLGTPVTGMSGATDGRTWSADRTGPRWTGPEWTTVTWGDGVGVTARRADSGRRYSWRRP